MRRILALVFTAFLLADTQSAELENDEQNYRLPNVPYPSENPPSEAKRLLGKILFWDEQLSTDNSVACGSCHMPASAGADRRIGLHAGFDKTLGTPDDVIASLGVIARDKLGKALNSHAMVQVTDRNAPSFFAGIWSDTQFWDGRAQHEFIDPLTQKVIIKRGGALENQVLGPLMSDVEMAKQGLLMSELISKLTDSIPLALASDLPPDIQTWLNANVNYPALFERAFGDTSITFSKIAFAIATYERSLVADQTPWDIAMASGERLPYLQNLGWEYFKQSDCIQCHAPPLFTDNRFYNIGLQGENANKGRQVVSNDQDDLGKMKVPSLRNAGLRKAYMHTGHFSSLEDVFEVYANVPFERVTSVLPNGEQYNFAFRDKQQKAMIAFIRQSLTDPRVRDELFPFDRPKLRTEFASAAPSNVNFKLALHEKNMPMITWEKALKRGEDIQIVRNDGRHFWASTSPFIDRHTRAGEQYTYELSVRNGYAKESEKQSLSIATPTNTLSYLLILVIIICVASLAGLLRRRYSRVSKR
jgi:cytochrome c peroxidase